MKVIFQARINGIIVIDIYYYGSFFVILNASKCPPLAYGHDFTKMLFSSLIHHNYRLWELSNDVFILLGVLKAFKTYNKSQQTFERM